MSKYEIIVTFFTIVYGLMLTDLFLSFHKLLRCKNKVKWHWLPLLSAWYIFLTILKNWWYLTSFQGNTDWMNIYFFVAYAHLLIIIFLIVSAVFPDKPDQSTTNLKEYYFNNHRYFWGLLSTVVLLSVIINTMRHFQINETFNYGNIIGNSIYIGFTLLLAFTKKYWIHSGILILITLLTVLELLNK